MKEKLQDVILWFGWSALVSFVAYQFGSQTAGIFIITLIYIVRQREQTNIIISLSKTVGNISIAQELCLKELNDIKKRGIQTSFNPEDLS